VFKRFQKRSHALASGTRMSYSNPGNAIAGYLIEKMSGQPFDLYIAKLFCAPWAWKSDFPFTEQIGRYWRWSRENPPRVWGIPSSIRGCGGSKGFAGELAKLVQISLRRGKTGDALVKPNHPEDGSAGNHASEEMGFGSATAWRTIRASRGES